MTLYFPSADALQFALTSDLLPVDIARQPGRVAIGPKSDIWFEPHHFDLQPTEILTPFGISVNGPMPATSHYPVQHLWQALPLVAASKDAAISANVSVLFEIKVAGRLNTFINEHLRLGNDRIGIRNLGDRYLVLVQGPPYYSMLPSLELDDAGAPRAFIEQSPRFWVAIGWSYPLAYQIVVAEDQLVMVSPPCDWTAVHADKFRDVADCLDIAPPSRMTSARPDEMRDPWNIDIRLTPASSTEPPTLWIIRDKTLQQLDTLVQTIDAAIVDRFSFALTEADGKTVGFIRLRPSRLARPTIDIAGEPYRIYLRIPNLFVPITHRLQPPLHRETMRKLLAADANILHVVSAFNDNIQIESIAEAAFRPLSNYIDEVLRRDRAALSEWALATQFAFAELTQEELPSEAPLTTIPKPAGAKTAKPSDDVRAKSTAPLIRQRTRTPLTAPSSPAPIPKTDVDRRQQLHEVEQQFVTLGGALNSPQRRALWPQLARLNAELRQPAEAAIAWNHALWDADSFADEQLWGWVWAEQALQKPEITAEDITRLVSPTTPTPGDVRAFASVLTWGGQRTPIPAALRQALPQLQTYLQTHEHLLPIRAVWLAWLTWCRAAGGDSLTLARARDRLLARLLDRGLNPEVDLPSFLRFAGREDGDRLRAVRGWIEEIRQIVRQWFLQQSRDPAKSNTFAYMDLLFAIGFARLGEGTIARSLTKGAESVLTNVKDSTADAHDFLLQAFAWRVEEVLSGRGNNPWPPEMLEYLAQLRKERESIPHHHENNDRRLVPYAIDRLREQLRLLEPQENFDPYRNQLHRHLNEHVQAAAKLADEHKVQLLLVQMNEIIRKASPKPDVLIKVLSELMPLAGRIGAEQAGKLLDRVVPAFATAPKALDDYSLESRIRLLERSLYYAGHYDRSELIPQLVELLIRILEKEDVRHILEKFGRALGETLRNLRKFGFRDQTLVLLDRISTAVLANRTLEGLTSGPFSSWAKPLVPLLNVAAGWICLDQQSKAEPILKAAERLLDATGRAETDYVLPTIYVPVLYSTIIAYGYLPTQVGRERITNLFQNMRLQSLPNNFTVQMFYSWFHLNVAEAVVLALASHEFALGSAARHWLDEDEYLIRQRVHRDVRAAVGRG